MQPRTAGSHFSSVIPIRPYGSAPPLLLIHGVGGEIPDARCLLEKLDPRQPVYGIQSQALDQSQTALTRLEEMAAYHLREIRRVVPSGPYCFLGFSFGGMVAFELAQQLIATGDKAAFVGMVDSCEMSYPKRQSKTDTSTRRAAALSRRIRTRLAEAVQRTDTVEYVKEKIRSRSLRTLYSVMSQCNLSVPKALQSAYHINWFAAVNYTPRFYPGDIKLFKAKEHFWESRIPPDLGWASLVENIELFEIPGGHSSMFMEPGVSVLGNNLLRCLETVVQGNSLVVRR